jgi:hypothetical protein
LLGTALLALTACGKKDAPPKADTTAMAPAPPPPQPLTIATRTVIRERCFMTRYLL